MLSIYDTSISGFPIYAIPRVFHLIYMESTLSQTSDWSLSDHLTGASCPLMWRTSWCIGKCFYLLFFNRAAVCVDCCCVAYCGAGSHRRTASTRSCKIAYTTLRLQHVGYNPISVCKKNYPRSLDVAGASETALARQFFHIF